MAREIERAGFPIAVITNLTDIAASIGANRVVQGSSIPHPTGNPSMEREKELAFRKNLVGTALTALETKLSEKKVF